MGDKDFQALRALLARHGFRGVVKELARISTQRLNQDPRWYPIQEGFMGILLTLHSKGMK